MREMSIKEYQKFGRKLFGDNLKKWKFVCPRCGNVASGQDFANLGKDMNDACQNCIGRFSNTVDCDWAAYGLFLTMGKGYLVHLDDGTDVHCFPFLEPIGTEQVSIQ